ncbi:major facilitator superfamily domain-containing protein [Zychaea mexicana]|uniref:major facilitator superfamily domain-containing protein n=1 Tax=Zychaea mexicana TaxID=64656 RepID=UPI0022FF37C2|nr:major facilitator superfamily domain-containing protein [Zychaea mexicana]KAI9497585.1 major facilitator superfamily domain-containing protein [Zychaea mexicana]
MFSRFRKDTGEHTNYSDEKKTALASGTQIEHADNVEAAIAKSNSSSDGKSDNFIEPDEKELRRLMWKLDRRIIPYISLLYLCSYLDRVNIGNAKIAGLMEDIDITESQYNWALSIFFIGYVLFEVPSNLMLKVLGPRIWISIIVIAESALYPGVLFYLSVWYTRRQQALRIALFYGSSTLAGAFGGVLAYGIMHMEGLRGLSGWQWIFIIEAIPTLLLGVLTYFVLPDYPESARFLNEREREIIVMRNKRDAGVATDTHFSWHQVGSTFIDWKIYAYSVIYLCAAIPVYSFSMFMPSIVNGMGYTNLTAQLMSSPPYACAFVWCIMNAYDADRRGERGFHMAFSAIFSLIGYVLMITLHSTSSVALYIGAIIGTMGAFGIIPPMTSWFSNNFGGHTRRNVAVALVTSFGNTSGAISGQVYRAYDAPLYIKGHTACLVLMAGCAVTALMMKFTLYRINKKRDNMTPEEYRIASEGTELGEKVFRKKTY